jgi:hypothetical protein
MDDSVDSVEDFARHVEVSDKSAGELLAGLVETYDLQDMIDSEELQDSIDSGVLNIFREGDVVKGGGVNAKVVREKACKAMAALMAIGLVGKVAGMSMVLLAIKLKYPQLQQAMVWVMAVKQNADYIRENYTAIVEAAGAQEITSVIEEVAKARAQAQLQGICFGIMECGVEEVDYPVVPDAHVFYLSADQAVDLLQRDVDVRNLDIVAALGKLPYNPDLLTLFKWDLITINNTTKKIDLTSKTKFRQLPKTYGPVIIAFRYTNKVTNVLHLCYSIRGSADANDFMKDISVLSDYALYKSSTPHSVEKHYKDLVQDHELEESYKDFHMDIHGGLCNHGIVSAAMIVHHLIHGTGLPNEAFENGLIELQLFGHSLGASSAMIAGHVFAKMSCETMSKIVTMANDVSQDGPKPGGTIPREGDAKTLVFTAEPATAVLEGEDLMSESTDELTPEEERFRVDAILQAQKIDTNFLSGKTGTGSTVRQKTKALEFKAGPERRLARPKFTAVTKSGLPAQYNVSVQVVSCPMYAKGETPLSHDASVMPANLTCCAYTSPYDKVLINNPLVRASVASLDMKEYHYPFRDPAITRKVGTCSSLQNMVLSHSSWLKGNVMYTDVMTEPNICKQNRWRRFEVDMESDVDNDIIETDFYTQDPMDPEYMNYKLNPSDPAFDAWKVQDMAPYKADFSPILQTGDKSTSMWGHLNNKSDKRRREESQDEDRDKPTKKQVLGGSETVSLPTTTACVAMLSLTLLFSCL